MEDWNDIYRGRYGSYYGHSGEDLEYEDQMEVYSQFIPSFRYQQGED